MTNLAHNLIATARRRGGRIAVKLDHTEIPYKGLEAASARVAGLLRSQGLQTGDRVGVMLPNVPHFPIVYYGILRAGGVVIPMNPLLKAGEVAYYLSDSGARHLFAWHQVASEAHGGAATAGAQVILVCPGEFEELLGATRADRDVAGADDQDTAVILYTSGTTGKPKGAELTHANLRRNTELVATDLLHLTEHDVIFGALPLFHSFGQTCTLNAAVHTGARLVLLPRFDPTAALELLQHERVTVFAGVPTMYAALLGHPDRAKYDLSSLRVCISGGASMPAEVMRGFEETFGCVVLEGYGLSETSPVASFNHPDRARKPGSIGTPIRGVQMRVIDQAGNDVPPGQVGEIAIRGHNLMKGYWNKPEATAEAIPDRWLRTGDMGRVDSDGYFFIVDRKKELIIRGGYNVYPREIEEVLYTHPAVAEAAVVGLPHPELGEEVGAAVTLKPGATATPEQLRDHVKRQLAAYKYPRRVWIVEALPKGPTGKILKRQISPPEGLLA